MSEEKKETEGKSEKRERRKMVVAIINNMPFIQTPFFETSVKLLFETHKTTDIAWMNVKSFPVDFARNQVVKEFLTNKEYNDMDWIGWLDTDQTFPPEMFNLLFDAIDKDDRIKIISGVYFKRSFHNEIVAWNYIGNKKVEPILDGTVQAVEVFGPGCSLMHRSVLEEIGFPWFKYGPLHENLEFIASEDIHFCTRVKEIGEKIWLHTGITSGHLMQVENIQNKIKVMGPGPEEFGKVATFDNVDDLIAKSIKEASNV